MTTPSTRRQRSTAHTVLGAIVLTSTLCLSGCESEPSRTTNRPTPPPANDTMPAPGEPGSPIVRKNSAENPIATIPSEWPGVESRLVTCSRRGQMLLVEIALVNTGAGPASIENYSATEATMIDDVMKQPVGPFDAGAGIAATTDLTRVLQPGEVATVSASFPVGPTSQLATLTFPKLGIFTAIEIDSGPNYRNKTREEFNAEGGGNRRLRNRNVNAAK